MYPLTTSLQLTSSLRNLRQKSVSVLKDMASELTEMGARESTVEARRAFVDACKPIQELPEVRPIVCAIPEFLADIGRNRSSTTTHSSLLRKVSATLENVSLKVLRRASQK